MTGELIGCVVSLAFGGLTTGMALWQIRTGKLRFLHWYRTDSLVPIPRALALKTGIPLLVAGICIMLMGSSLLLPERTRSVIGIVLLPALVVSIILSVIAVIHHRPSSPR